eukprot:5957078-Pyramimonas_sp.AAC.1
MFEDCATLASDRACDIKSKKVTCVPPLDIIVAGFSCKAVSHLNKDAPRARTCVATKALSTGVTFDGILGYCRRWRPKIIILENVVAICDSPDGGMSNADAVIMAMQGLGYTVHLVTMDPRDYGIPQRRKRAWFLCGLGTTIDDARDS